MLDLYLLKYTLREKGLWYCLHSKMRTERRTLCTTRISQTFVNTQFFLAYFIFIFFVLIPTLVQNKKPIGVSWTGWLVGCLVVFFGRLEIDFHIT